MFDQSLTPPSRPGTDVRIYNPTGQTDLQGFQTWRKPQGAAMVFMITIAGGGGGGGGFSGAAASTVGGGGSGACSGTARFLVPAMFLPDVLYIQVGSGGPGGAAGAAGTVGRDSLILTSKTEAIPNIICRSGVNAPGGGGAGTSTAGGAAGSVPTIAVTDPIHAMGQWFATVGLVGIIGGDDAGAAGGNITAWAALPMSPGASGAGTAGPNFAGGNQTATGTLDVGNQGYYTTATGSIAAGGAAGGAGGLRNGGSGIKRLTPFFNSGGAGGGTLDGSEGGYGGSGGYGCGGGGGAGGNPGGEGGNGGDGLVVIISW